MASEAQTIRQLERELDRLQQRLQTMEQQLAAPPPGAPVVPQIAAGRGDNAPGDTAGLTRDQLADRLAERVKELECLYQISEVLSESDDDLPAIFRGVVESLPRAWRHADACGARIIVGEDSYVAGDLQPATEHQRAAIVADEQTVGHVEVYYTTPRPDADEGPFLDEERALINVVAERLGRAVAMARRSDALRRSHRELEQRVTERTAQLDRRLRAHNAINRIFDRALHCQTVEQVAEGGVLALHELTQSTFSFVGYINSAGRLDVLAMSGPGCEACRHAHGDGRRCGGRSLTGGLLGRVLSTGQAVAVNEPSECPFAGEADAGVPRISAFLGVPILIDGRVAGLVGLANKPDGYTDADRGDAEAAVSSLHEAIRRKQAELALKHARDELEERVAARTEQLAASEERFRRLIRRAPLPMCFIDNDEKLKYINERFITLFGYRLEDVPDLEAWWRRACPDGDGPDAAARWRHAIADARRAHGELDPAEYTVTCGDGSTRDLWIGGVALEDGCLMTCHDVTRINEATNDIRRLNESLTRTNEELEQFAYAASHDLKTPLITFQGYLAQLERQLASEDLAGAGDSIERMRRAARRMSALIDDLLELSRIGRIVSDPEPVDVAALVQAFVEFNDAQLAEAGVTVTVQPDLPWVVADKTRMQQVFDNLLANALRYGCGDDGGDIEVGGEVAGDRVRYFVRDHGPGIPPQHHDRVFGLFQKLETSPGGTGIGLAIVRRAIEWHGGTVGVESTPGDGATFHVTLPISRWHQPDDPPQGEPS